MIGLALVKVGIQYAAGGVPAIGTPEYGTGLNWLMAGTVIVVTLGLKFFTRGMLSVSAVLVGLLVGYVVAFALGQVNLGNVGRAAPFALPNPLHFGMEFSVAAVIGFCAMSFVSAVETVGDVSGITKGGAGREATDKEIQGATFADGLGTAVSGLFGALQYLPGTLKVLMTSGILPAALIAIILNLVLPDELSDESTEEVSGGMSGHRR
jgi:NCS2 family nucleobase:cation symporter-2